MNLPLSHILCSRVVLLILCVVVFSFSQEEYEELKYDPEPDTTVQQEIVQPVSPTPTYLQKDITAAKVLGTVGCITHFTGSMMIFSSFFTGDPIVNWIGTGFDIMGPLPSCIGASLIEDAMEEEDSSFPRNPYWSHYGTGSLFYAVNIGLGIAQFAILARQGGFVHPASPIVFVILSIGTYGAGEVYTGMATVGPLLYARKAERRLEKKNAFSLRVLPSFTMNGGKGATLFGTF